MPDRLRETVWRHAFVLVIRLHLDLSIGKKGEHQRLVDIADLVKVGRQVSDLCDACAQLLIRDGMRCFLVVVKEINGIQEDGTVLPPGCAPSRREMPYAGLQPAVSIDAMQCI